MIDNEVIVHIFRTGVPAVIRCIESVSSLAHSILVGRILLYVHRILYVFLAVRIIPRFKL